MTKFVYVIVVVLTLCQLFHCANGSRILMLTPLGSKSHKSFYWTLAEALGQKGHEVTVVSMYKNSGSLKNVRDIVLPGPSLDGLMNEIFTQGPNTVMQNLVLRMPEMCSESLSYAKDLKIHEEKYDLILLSLFFDFCYLSIIHEQQVPYIYVSPAGIFSIFSHIVGNVWLPSIEPNKLLSGSYPPSFLERFQSTLLDLGFVTAYDYLNEPRMESICRERGLCPIDMPPLRDFHANVSLVLANSIQTLEIPPRPMMPNIVHAGGLHCRPGKPLPKDLEDWVEGSGDAGFIFFSMGSAVRPSFLTDNYRKILLNAFATLEQRVLFKWDLPDMEDLPPNVKLGKWLPQQDLLAHPKMKLFITHGGLHSTMETTYHGVPVIGIPIMADQYSNLYEAESQGWAKIITWDQLEEKKLINLIKDVMADEKMKIFLKERAAIMKDQLLPPVEIATYWVEYVIRHKGADHIKSPIAKMSWYTLYNADVWLLLFVILLGILNVLWRSIKMIFTSCLACCRSSRKLKKA